MRKTVSVSLFLFLVVGILFAQQAPREILIREILNNVRDLQNTQVVIQGKVVEVQTPVRTDAHGFYILMDSSDQKIKIISDSLPAPQTSWKVIGTIFTLEDGEPYIRERIRSEPSDSTPWHIYALIALIAVILITLLVVIFKKPKEQPVVSAPYMGPQVSQSSAPAGTPSWVAQEKTRMVSVSEVEQAVGGMKTKQVPSLLAELRVVSGLLAGKSYPLAVETVIGRVRGDIILEDSSVSREHAKVVFIEGKYVLENMSQTNPVLLNGEKVQTQKDLKPGDEIICGLIKLQFRLL